MQRVYHDGLNPPPAFNLVFHAALLQSDIHLTHYLNQSIATIDVRVGGKFGVITPAGLHAMYANEDAVRFLVRHHADIDFVGYGAALANRVEQAEFWRKSHGAHPDMLARAAAYAGNMEYATTLKTKYGASSLEIGIGLVMGAHHLLFKKWLLQDNVFIGDDELNALAVAAGIAGSASIELTDILCRLNDAKTALNTGAAMAGRSHFNQSRDTMEAGVEKGLMDGGHLQLLPLDAFDKHESARMAWKSSHIDFLIMYYERMKRAKKIVPFTLPLTTRAISDSRNIHLIEHMTRFHPEVAPLLEPTFYFKYNNPMSFKLLTYYFQKNPSLKAKMVEYLILIKILPNTAMALHLFVFHSTPAFNELLLEVAAEDENIKMQLTGWMKQADIIRRLMQRYEFNFDQALAITNSADLRRLLLCTVKDFTTCFSSLPLDIKACIISHLSDLSLADAKNIIEKVRHYKLVVNDIWRIAAAFQQYADNVAAPLRERATSLSTALYATRQLALADDLITQEFTFVIEIEVKHLDCHIETSSKDESHRQLCGFFSSVRLSNPDGDLPAHCLPLTRYDETYNQLVLTHFNTLSSKSALSSFPNVNQPASHASTDENGYRP